MRCSFVVFAVVAAALLVTEGSSTPQPVWARQAVIATPKPTRPSPVPPPARRPDPPPFLQPPAQTPAPRPSAPPPVTRARSATRTLRAVLVSVDAARSTLQLREDGMTGSIAGGGDGDGARSALLTVFADPAAQYAKTSVKSGARLSDFAPGEIVVARVTLRQAAGASGQTGETGLLRALWDDASYQAERSERRDICVGVVASWGRLGDSVAVRRASDGEIVAFRVTVKTLVCRNDGAGRSFAADNAASGAYPVGAPVAVKPRALPSGDLMAALIAPTERDALAAYQDGLATWSGEAIALDEQAQTLTLRRDDGAIRTVALVSLDILKRGRAVILPSRAVVGQPVRVHLRKGAERDGLRVADAVTIPTRRSKRGDASAGE